jgi:hypothetical protein
MPHILLESSRLRLQLCLKPHLNWRATQNVMGLQNRRSPIFDLGVLTQSEIWVEALWPGTDNTIRGKGGGFPQVWVMVSLMSSCLPMVYPCTKNVLTCCLVCAGPCE